MSRGARNVLAACGAAVAAAVALASCSLVPNDQRATASAASHSNPPTPVEQRFGRGPVELVVDLSGTTVAADGRLELTLMTRAKPGWSVRPPSIGRHLGGFAVARKTSERDGLSKGNRIFHTTSYFLEPYLPGTYVIPPLRVKATNGTSSVEVASDKLEVTVRSLLPKGAKKPLELKQVAGPVALPSLLPIAVAGSLILLAALSATFLFLFGHMRRRREERRGSVAPWERALRELDRMTLLDFPSRRMQREFYLKISRLVRRYIEDMFGLRAPDQTTEEFLYAARDSEALGRHRHILDEFLSHCDIVKFAGYLPAQDEIQRAVYSCRVFIDSTKDE